MIRTILSGKGPGGLEDYATSRVDAFAASFEEAISDNPSVRIFNYADTKDAGGNKLSLEEAKTRSKDAGVEVHNLPEEGINEDALAIMIERQYRKKVRAEVMAAAPSGLLTGAAELAGGLVGSLLDPINLGISFIPFIGVARPAAFIAGATSGIGRFGARAAVGAAQGAIGTAVTEAAFNYPLAQRIGDDYDTTNVLANVAFGTAIGGGLHAVSGVFGDLLAARKEKTIADVVDKMPLATREQLARVAVAQAMEDRPINVDPLLKVEERSVKQRLKDIYRKIRANPEEKKALELERKKLQEQLPEKEAKDLAPESRELQGEGEVTEEALPELEPGEGPTAEEIQADIEKANTEPDSNFIDEEAEKFQIKELADSTRETEAAEALQEMNDAVNALQENLRDPSGVKTEEMLHEANKLQKESTEYRKALKGMADCLLRMRQ